MFHTGHALCAPSVGVINIEPITIDVMSASVGDCARGVPNPFHDPVICWPAEVVKSGSTLRRSTICNTPWDDVPYGIYPRLIVSPVSGLANATYGPWTPPEAGVTADPGF